MEQNRHEIEETDYDAGNGKRWYFRLFCDAHGRWYWEPRPPTPAELLTRHQYAGFTWEPTTVRADEWPTQDQRGPFQQRAEAITAAEEWFDVAP